MAKQTFTTGQVLSAAQMTSLQQTAMGGGSATAKTGSYVLTAADAGCTVIMNAAGATTITVNTGLFAAGDTVFIQNIGAGVCTITAGTATVNTAGSLALSQYEGASLYFTATGAAILNDYTQTAGSSGTKNFTLLNTGGTALSGSTTVTVSGISNADVIFVYISGASSGTNANNVSIRVNGLSTGIYNYAGPYISAGSGYGASNFGIRAGNSEVRTVIGEWSDNSSSTISGWFRITGAATSGQKIIDFQTGATASGGTGQDLVWGGGYIDTSAAITSISLIQDDGINFDAGTIRVYTTA